MKGSLKTELYHETVTFDNKDQLIIHNWGCEYFVLTFRFETSRFQDNVDNLVYWYLIVYVLMTEIIKGLDTPFVTSKKLATLKSFTEDKIKTNPKSFKIGEKIKLSGDDSVIRNFITVDKIEKITDKKFGIEISFSIGPL